MNYIVDIIDTQDNNSVLSLEKARRDSIVLDWKGSDKKDELSIVGSALSFTMVGMSCEDGQYYDLFTGDESRFKVRLYDENNNTIWTGFLLPDTYSEPYNDSPILIDFVASDGLGRIKGKYLPDEYYEDEFSVIQIIAKCLELTGLQLDFRFAPAIENTQQKDYNQIYIDTARFKEKNKKQDAYKILDDILTSMICTLYQADNYWNIEGFNIRTRRVYNTKIYNYLGFLLDQTDVTRLRKNITAIATPIVTPQAPYGVINVTHKKELLALPETLTNEINDGWVIPRGAFVPILPTDWINISGYIALADGDTGAVALFNEPIDGGRIELRARPYIAKNKKYRITFSFKIEDVFQSDTERQNAVDNGFWTDPFYMTVKVFYKDIDGVEQVKFLYTNDPFNFNNAQQMSIEFNENGEATKTISFISNYSGLMDIVLTSIVDSNNSKISRVFIEEASLSEIAQEDEYFTEIINPLEYTTKKEVELVYGGDSTGMSTAFRLRKLKTKGTATNIPVEVMRSFNRDGFWWATVDLLGANLIKDNIEDASTTSGPLEVLEVVYNYLNSDEHAIKLNNQLAGGSEINVAVFDYNTVTEDRQYWEEWTDTFAKIERKPYEEVVKNVLYDLFKVPVWSLDSDLYNNIKFNDFLNWNFRGDKDFILTNCKWNIDIGRSTVRGSENFYNVEQGVNLPPIVEAGSDIYISETQDAATLTSEAYDPDGFIVSYLWEEVTNNGAIITNPNDNNTTITGLTEDFYTFRVTVTDNEGATTSDTVNVYRVEMVDVSMVVIKDTTEVVNGNDNREVDWRLNVAQDIGSSSINLKGTVIPTMTDATFNMYIYKNGSIVFYHQNPFTRDFSVSYVQGDIIEFETWTNKQNSGSVVNLEIRIEEGDFVDGVGQVNGLPITVSNTQ